MENGLHEKSPGFESTAAAAIGQRNKPAAAAGSYRVTRRLFTALLVGFVLAGACDGGNLFDGEGTEFTPLITAITLPQVAFAGEQVSIRVDAAAPRGVSQVLLALRGAVNKDTTVVVRPAQSRISQVISVAIPSALQDTLVLVRASVIDGIGDESLTRESTIVVFGPPIITGLLAPSIVRLGDLISLRVSAVGARKVSKIDLVVRGALQKDTTVMVLPARTNVTQDIVFSVPGSAQDTLLSLSLSVQDALGQAGDVISRTIPIAIEPPLVALTAPATANAGLDLNVSVEASSTRQISQIRLELRGAYVKDVSMPISPPQSSVLQNITVPLPGNILTSDLRVRAAAVDRGGAVAYSSESSILIPLGPPSVWSLEVPSSMAGGKTVDVRVRARGDRPISTIEVRFRGAVDANKTIQINPARIDVVQDASVTIPVTPTDSVLVVMATAIDMAGSVSEIVSQSVPFATTSPAPAPEAVSLAMLTGTARSALRSRTPSFLVGPPVFELARRTWSERLWSGP